MNAHNISHALCCGSLLGEFGLLASPWDDDVDVGTYFETHWALFNRGVGAIELNLVTEMLPAPNKAGTSCAIRTTPLVGHNAYAIVNFLHPRTLCNAIVQHGSPRLLL